MFYFHILTYKQGASEAHFVANDNICCILINTECATCFKSTSTPLYMINKIIFLVTTCRYFTWNYIVTNHFFTHLKNSIHFNTYIHSSCILDLHSTYLHNLMKLDNISLSTKMFRFFHVTTKEESYSLVLKSSAAVIRAMTNTSIIV